MTRLELVQRLARRLNYNASSIDSATSTRLIEMLNDRHRIILSQPGMRRLRDGRATFASVASTTDYGLVNVARIYAMWEGENWGRLCEMSPDTYASLQPDPTINTGSPATHFVWRDYVPVAKQPADASSIFIKSTSGSDTNTAYIEGEISGGYARSASVTMTGTTAVNFASSIASWIRITKLYLSAAAVGTVTVHEDSGSGTELAQIAVGQTQQRYQRITLWPTPSDAVTYTYDFQRLTTDLAQDTDEPLLPQDFHDLLLDGAMAEEYEKRDDSRVSLAQAKYDARMKALRYHLAETATGEDHQVEGPSKFSGSYYPSGPWGWR